MSFDFRNHCQPDVPELLDVVHAGVGAGQKRHPRFEASQEELRHGDDVAAGRIDGLAPDHPSRVLPRDAAMVQKPSRSGVGQAGVEHGHE